jgi:hypothetical protein
VEITTAAMHAVKNPRGSCRRYLCLALCPAARAAARRLVIGSRFRAGERRKRVDVRDGQPELVSDLFGGAPRGWRKRGWAFDPIRGSARTSSHRHAVNVERRRNDPRSPRQWQVRSAARPALVLAEARKLHVRRGARAHTRFGVKFLRIPRRAMKLLPSLSDGSLNSHKLWFQSERLLFFHSKLAGDAVFRMDLARLM